MRKEISRGLAALTILTEGGVAAGSHIASAESNPPPIHEEKVQLEPIEVKTVDMEPGIIYRLQPLSIVISNGRKIVVNDKVLEAPPKKDLFLLSIEKKP